MEYHNPLTLEGISLHDAILQQMPFGVLIVEAPSGRLLFHNQESAELLRHDMFDMARGRADGSWGAVHKDGQVYAESEYPLARALQGDTVRQEELLYRRGDGSLTCLLVNAAPIRDAEGNVIRAIATFDDISERKQFELNMAKTQAKLQLATKIAKLGFFEWELKSNRVFYSSEWKRQIGYEDHELPNRFEEWESRLHPSEREEVLQTIRQFLAAPWANHEVEFRLQHRDGSYRWICCRADVLYDDSGQVRKLVGTHLDITERKETEECIRHIVQHDSLTGLPNRALLYEFAEHILAGAGRAGEQVAVLFVDVDRFKPVNDTYGHHVGDEVLREVAWRLKQSVRPEDVVARLGGDEFLVLTSRIQASGDAMNIAQKLLTNVSRPYRINDIELQLSPSVGLSLFPEDGSDIGTLIRNADTAMYHAKESGRNNFQFFTRALERRAARTLDIENRLRAGLENGDFELFYQPILNAQTHRLAAAEALLRWPQKDGTFIHPESFIPIAERAGLILPLGEWVLEEACDQHMRWQQEGLPPVRIAVNLSPVQFRNRTLEASITRILSQRGLAPSALELEVTESMIMENVDDATTALNKLRDMGIRIALDDFGTGYSSLSQLGRLPLDKLKVDQSFVKNLFRDQVSVAITEAIIGLGHNLGLDIVAEGIESEKALSFLNDKACDEIQGFYLSHPIRASEFAGWYRQRC